MYNYCTVIKLKHNKTIFSTGYTVLTLDVYLTYKNVKVGTLIQIQVLRTLPYRYTLNLSGLLALCPRRFVKFMAYELIISSVCVHSLCQWFDHHEFWWRLCTPKTTYCTHSAWSAPCSRRTYWNDILRIAALVSQTLSLSTQALSSILKKIQPLGF